LKDWLTKVNDQRTKGQLDLNQALEIKIDAKRDSNCSLGDVVVTDKTGDHRRVALAIDLMSAIGDSGILGLCISKIESDPGGGSFPRASLAVPCPEQLTGTWK